MGSPLFLCLIELLRPPTKWLYSGIISRKQGEARAFVGRVFRAVQFRVEMALLWGISSKQGQKGLFSVTPTFVGFFSTHPFRVTFAILRICVAHSKNIFVDAHGRGWRNYFADAVSNSRFIKIRPAHFQTSKVQNPKCGGFAEWFAGQHLIS